MTIHQKKLTEEIEKESRLIQKLLLNYYGDVMKLSEIKKALESGKPLWFDKNKTAERQVNKLLTGFRRDLEGTLLNALKNSAEIGINAYVDEMRAKVKAGNDSIAYAEKLKDISVTETRTQALNSSARKYADRFKLSGRVWNLGEFSKKEIEVVIQNAIKEGKTPAQVSREMRKYLNEPDKRFKPVKNKETGKYELSEAAKKYKPGSGVYRSAAKNADRLVRTEMAAIYRHAQLEQIRKNPNAIGIRIQLSNNHTLNGKPFHCICDDLQGDYPKDFIWTGWHPHCRCVATAILVSGEEATKAIQAYANGEDYIPKTLIKELPSQIKNWYKNNSYRFSDGQQKPFWLLDNEDAILKQV